MTKYDKKFWSKVNEILSDSAESRASEPDFDAYQDAAERTASGEHRVERAFLGIAGEAGEVCEARKKFLRGDYDLVRYERRLVGELGDLLWYVAECCTVHGLSLVDVAQQNIDTLADRASRGAIQGDGDGR